MPQEIRVLKCFKCEIYQTDIVKKAKKWQCKICGEKQSVQYEFGRGTGQECRLISQKLNDKRQNNDVLEFSLYENLLNDENHANSYTEGGHGPSYTHSTQNLNEIRGRNQNNTGVENKWSKFVETTNDNGSDDGDFHESSSSKFESHSFRDVSQDSNVNRKSFKRSLENDDDDDDDERRSTKIYKKSQNIKGIQNARNISNVSLLTNQSEKNKKTNNSSKWSKWIDNSND